MQGCEQMTSSVFILFVFLSAFYRTQGDCSQETGSRGYRDNQPMREKYVCLQYVLLITHKINHSSVMKQNKNIFMGRAKRETFFTPMSARDPSPNNCIVDNVRTSSITFEAERFKRKGSL